jgi:hypothetical protein
MTLWNKFCKADSTFDVCKSHQLRFYQFVWLEKSFFFNKETSHSLPISLNIHFFPLSFISLTHTHITLSLTHSLTHNLSLLSSLSHTHKHTQHTLFSLSNTHSLPFPLFFIPLSHHTHSRSFHFSLSLSHTHSRPLSLSLLPFHSLCVSQCSSWHTHKHKDKKHTHSLTLTHAMNVFNILTLSL